MDKSYEKVGKASRTGKPGKTSKTALIVFLIMGLIVCGLIFPLSSQVMAQEEMPNLLSNPGFELPINEDGSIPNWRINGGASAIKPGIKGEVTDSQSFSGNSSLFVEDTTASAAIVFYSDLIPVMEAQTYIAKAKVKDVTGTIYLGLRYYKTNADFTTTNHLKTSFYALPAASIWTDALIEAQAPQGAAFARILLYTTSATMGKASFDELSLKLKPAIGGPVINYTLKDLGSTVHTVNTHRAAFGTDAAGRLLAYSTLVGAPANLLVIDVETDTLLKQIPIQANVNGTLYSCTYVRGLSVMPDGTVYLAGSPSNMFKYVPGTDHVEYLGKAGGSQVFDMKPGPNGTLIGGTYNKSEGFQFDPATGTSTNLGRMHDTEFYAYSVAYDELRNDAYFGIGSHAHLIKLDMDTGVKTEIPLPSSLFADSLFVFDMTISADKLFMRMSPGDTIAYDLETEQFDDHIGVVSSRLMSPKSPVDNKVYYSASTGLGYYDLDTKQYTSLGIYTDGEVYGFTFAQLQDPAYPGYSLIGVTREARVFKYNLQTGSSSYTILPVVGEPTELQTVAKGNDGRLHTSGYLSGGNAILDPITGAREEYTNETLGLGQRLPQTDRVFTYKDKAYYTTYPNMNIFEFDMTKPWNRKNTADQNPKLLFSAYDAGYQDRGLAGVMLEDSGKFVIGTVPKYGYLGGALVIYDLNTNEREAYHNIVPDQSVTAVTYKDGFVYGGSNIWGGLGINPTATEAKLFVWDMEARSKVFEIAPIPGARGITELIVGPDGNIWGSAEGYLFIFNPATRQIVHQQLLMPRSYGSAVWRDAQFEIGTDGNVYGVQGDKFFRIDAVTKEMAVIRDVGLRNWLAQDDFGRFYLTEGTKLLQLTIPELVVRPLGIQLTLSSTSLLANQSAEPAVRALLEKGHTVNKLEQRDIPYFSSNPSVVKVENGRFVALRAGTAEVWSVVTLEGTAYTSNRVTITVNPTFEKLIISGLNESMTAGESAQTVVEAVYEQVNRVDVTPLSLFQSTDPLVATVDAGGIVHAVSAGQTVISATYGGLNQSFQLSVKQAPDTAAPSWTNGTVTAADISQTGLHLEWTKAFDQAGVTSYKVYRGAEPLATVAGSVYAFDVTGLAAGTTYTFTIEAGDAAGNWSKDGPSITVTTLCHKPDKDKDKDKHPSGNQNGHRVEGREDADRQDDCRSKLPSGAGRD